METDTEFAIDAIFRAAHGAERALASEERDMAVIICAVAGIMMAKQGLEKRGWKWQPDEEPTVIQMSGDTQEQFKEKLWKNFMDKLLITGKTGEKPIVPVNFLGSAESYRKLFMEIELPVGGN